MAKYIYPILILFVFIATGFFPNKLITITIKTDNGYLVDTIATELTVPWEIVFLPDKTMLFTERNGKVRIFRHNQLSPGPALVLNDIDATKKMGLLGMCIHPQFSKNRYVYLSYNYRKEAATLLKIVRYQFLDDTLVRPVIILENINASSNHTGCRLKFGNDRRLYITTGDADKPILAQDLKSLNGKILRVADDGSIPSDNPFYDNDTARKEIWTYGHRNTQGIDFEPGTSQLFNSEHGPTGGDEINVIVRGQNYGWPFIHHRDKRHGMTSPLLEFTPSIGPSAMVFYGANAFPSLKGKLLLACLRAEKIMQIKKVGKNMIFEDNVIQNAYGRIRALVVGPDGYIYFSTSQNDPPEGEPTAGYDMILRLKPSSIKNTANVDNPIGKEVKTKVVAVKKKTPDTYKQLCASCHGNNLEGTNRGESLIDNKWHYGSKRSQIFKNISEGIIGKGMPAWQGALNKKEIESLTNFIIARAKKK